MVRVLGQLPATKRAAADRRIRARRRCA